MNSPLANPSSSTEIASGDARFLAAMCVEDADSMHARYYTGHIGRFVSVDPVLNLRRTIKRPQAWNRYSYTLSNPLKYVDPTGTIFVLSGCAAGDQKKCGQQAQLLYDTLGAKASRYISVNTKTGVVSLAGTTQKAFGKQFGDFAKGIGALIGSNDTFSLITDSGRAAGSGGGGFAEGANGGGEILIETGMFPSLTGRVTQTPQTALVHETGHALRQVFPSHFNQLENRLSGGNTILYKRGEGFAVNFENRYRQDRGLEGPRYTYDRTLPDVLVDFGVDLFPPN